MKDWNIENLEPGSKFRHNKNKSYIKTYQGHIGAVLFFIDSNNEPCMTSEKWLRDNYTIINN